MFSFLSVGKGTFASRLSPYFNIPTISTGDLIRAEIKNNTAIGRDVKSTIERGELVQDQTVFALLQKRLSEKDCLENGYILDGYPRRVTQAETLIAHQINLQLTINLNLDKNILLEKALARRVCQDCGNGYNVASIIRDGYHMPPLLPKVEGKCDKVIHTRIHTTHIHTTHNTQHKISIQYITPERYY